MTQFSANRRFLFGMIVCFTVLNSTATYASVQVSATFSWYDPGSPWAVTLDPLDALGHPNPGAVHEDTLHAGLFHWTSQSPNSPDFINGVAGIVVGPGSGIQVTGDTNFISVCVDLTQPIGFGPQGLMSVIDLAEAPQPGSNGPGSLPDSPMGSVAARYLATLWANYLDDALRPGAPGAVNRGAFQLAAWKIAYDEGLTFNLGTGRLVASTALGPSSTPSVGSVAQGWLNSLAGLGQGDAQSLRALTKGPTGVFQDQVVGVLPSLAKSEPVPEATSLVTWGLLVAVIGLSGAYRRERLLKST